MEFEVAHDFRRVYGMVTQDTVLGISRGFTWRGLPLVFTVFATGTVVGAVVVGGLDALLRYDVAIRANRRT